MVPRHHQINCYPNPKAMSTAQESIKWVDVAHHYAKSNIQIFVGKFDHGPEMGMVFETGLHDKWEYCSHGLFVEVENGGFLSEWESHKPVLRPITAMTEDERKELWRLIFSQGKGSEFQDGFKDFRGNAVRFDVKEPRLVMSQGVERLGIHDNGTVWADCDLNHWIFNPNITTHWLCSKGFDVFGLIDSKQAILKP